MLSCMNVFCDYIYSCVYDMSGALYSYACCMVGMILNVFDDCKMDA